MKACTHISEGARATSVETVLDLVGDPVGLFEPTGRANTENAALHRVYGPAPARRLFGGTEPYNLDKG